MNENTLAKKSDEFAYKVYLVTKTFPKEELFGITSQLRRAALSVILNIIEGYARQNSKVYSQFLRISYGSLKESLYLIDFSHRQGYLTTQHFTELTNMGDEVAKMIWATLQTLAKKS